MKLRNYCKLCGFLLCMGLLVLFGVRHETVLAENSYVTSLDCEYDGEPETIAYLGCNKCGGSGVNWDDPEFIKEHGGRYSGNNIVPGSGIEIQEKIEGNYKYIRKYRCSNCGDTGYDCKQYTELIEGEVYMKVGNTWLYSHPEYGTAAPGDTVVPRRWCTHCGPTLYTTIGKHNCYTDAKWAQKHLPPKPTPIPEYLLTVIAETGGSVGGDSGMIPAGTPVTVTAKAGKGYKFVGWSGTMGYSESPFSFTMPAQNVTLTAHFEKLPITLPPTRPPEPGVTLPPTPTTPERPNLLTVTFDSNGGSVSPTSKQVSYDGTYGTLPTPKKEGATFKYWIYWRETDGNQTSGIIVDANTEVLSKEDHTLVAEWYASTTKPPTPTPPDQIDPDKCREDYYYDNYYFTTDKNFYMDGILNDEEYTIFRQSGYGYQSEKLSSLVPSSGSRSYRIGTDTNGNEWYFLPSGTDAIYVHPKTYGEGSQKYNCYSHEISSITSLVFPEYITTDGVSYRVTSIGGNGAKYYTSSKTDIEYQMTWGSIRYSKSDSSDFSSKDITSLTTYLWGVMGNGHVESWFETYYLYTSSYNWTNREKNYYVYNTTLKSVTIPSTVTTIHRGAFVYCQALEEVIGCENVMTIEENAFSAPEEEIKAHFSISRRYNNPARITEELNYWYNESRVQKETPEEEDGEEVLPPKTQIMIEWEQTAPLSGYMKTPEFTQIRHVKEEAFSYKNNIMDITLGKYLSMVDINAFLECSLDSITILSPTAVVENEKPTQSHYATLGAKGKNYGNRATLIRTVPDAAVLKYGILWRDYYRIECGHEITYELNGGYRTDTGAYEPIKETSMFSTELPEIKYYTVIGNTTTNYQRNSLYLLDTEQNLWEYHLDDEVLIYQHLYSGDATKSLELLMTDVVEFVPAKYTGDNISDAVSVPNAHYVRLADGDLYLLVGKQYLRYNQNKQVYSGYYTQMLYLGNVNTDTNPHYNTSKDYVYEYQDTYGRWNHMMVVHYRYNSGTSRKFDITTHNFSAYQNKPPVIDTSPVYPGTSSSSGTGSVINISEKPYSYKTDSYFGIMQPLCCYNYEYSVTQYMGSTDTGSIHKNVSAALRNTSPVTLSYSTSTYEYRNGTMTKDDYENVSIPITDIELDFASLEYCGIYTGLTESNGYVSGDYYGGPYTSTSEDSFVILKDKNGYKQLSFVRSGDTIKVTAKELSFGDIQGVVNIVQTSRLRNENYLGYYLIDTEGYIYYSGSGLTTLVKAVPKPVKNLFWSNGRIYAVTVDDIVYSSSPYGKYFSVDSAFNRFENLTKDPGIGYGGLMIVDHKDYDAKQCLVFSNGDPVYQAWDVFKSRYLFKCKDNSVTDRYGFDFYEWNETPDMEGMTYVENKVYRITEPTTIYAIWAKSPDIIRYDRNGGKGTMEDTVFEDDEASVVLRKNTFTRDGYKFVGWNKRRDGASTPTYRDEATVDRTIDKISGTVILYAQWEPITYTLQYAKDDVRTNPKESELSPKETLELLQPHTVKDSLGDKTLTVSYDGNKGTGTTTPVWVTTDASSDAYTKATLEFSGWRLYKKLEHGTYDYKHQWYTAGTEVSALADAEGEEMVFFPFWDGDYSQVQLPIMSRFGYTFYGWSADSTEKDFTKILYMDVNDTEPAYYKPRTSETLYAVWQPDRKTVALEAPDADTHLQTAVTVTFDAKAPDLTELPTRECYKFRGYYTEPDGNGKKVYDQDGKGLVTCNTANNLWSVDTLYAYWVPKTLTSAKICIFSIDPTYVVEANLKEELELPTFEWREFGDTMLEISVETQGYFEYAVLKAPWEAEERVFYWEDGLSEESTETWEKDENIVFWRSQYEDPKELENVRRYPGFHDQTYTITIDFYIEDEVVKEYKLGLWMVCWDTWGAFIHPSRTEGHWDLNGDGKWDLYPFYHGNE